jgi:hypothetical protein
MTTKHHYDGQRRRESTASNSSLDDTDTEQLDTTTDTTHTYRMRLERLEQRRTSDPEGTRLDEFFAAEQRRRHTEKLLTKKSGKDGKRVRVAVHLFEFTAQVR